VSEPPIQIASEQHALQTRDPATAEEAFREIDLQLGLLEDASQKADLLIRRAVLLGVLQRFVDARKSLELASAQASGDGDIQLQVDYIRASLYDQEGDSGRAFEHLTALLSRNHERLSKPDLRFMYEDIQLRRGLDAAGVRKFQEAIPLLVESLGFGLSLEDRSNALSTLGLGYGELGQYERSKEYFLKACNIGLLKDWEGEVHMRLGIAYAHLDHFLEAKSEFRLCEDKASEYGLETTKIYGWLSWVCKGLGEKAEAEKYASLSRLS
jgi:tetratricopeptide (TPR) repeat protein